MQDFKSKALKVGAYLLPLMAMSTMAAAAYVPDYTTTDASPSIIDLIVGIIVGVAGQKITIGQAIGLSIALGALLGVLFMALDGVNRLRHWGKHK